MTGQQSLAFSRNTDPDTSRAAAESVDAKAIEAAILKVFYRRFATTAYLGEAGLTDDQLCRFLPERHGPTVKSARSRLTKAGRLINSGRTAPSDRGKASIIWKLA